MPAKYKKRTHREFLEWRAASFKREVGRLLRLRTRAEKFACRNTRWLRMYGMLIPSYDFGGHVGMFGHNAEEAGRTRKLCDGKDHQVSPGVWRRFVELPDYTVQHGGKTTVFFVVLGPLNHPDDRWTRTQAAHVAKYRKRESDNGKHAE